MQTGIKRDKEHVTENWWEGDPCFLHAHCQSVSVLEGNTFPGPGHWNMDTFGVITDVVTIGSTKLHNSLGSHL